MENIINLAIEYFKVLRNEIDNRIKIHSYLTISKITACAALLSYLVSNHADQMAFVSIMLLAFGLDLVIYHNIKTVNSIGRYIKTELEQKAFNNTQNLTWELYETKVAQTSKKGKSDLFLDRFGHLIITTAFMLMALLAPHFIHPDQEICLLPYFLLLIFLLLDGIASWHSRASD